MPDRDQNPDAPLVAQLNDLRKLDLEAIHVYDIAIRRLDDVGYREQIHQFRGDHEAHADALAGLIAERGGTPVDLPHIPSGAMKLALQALAVGDDRAVLLAFKANERQVRDKYQRTAEREHPPEIAVLLSRFAADESRHYDWAVETLSELGVGPETTAGRWEERFERGHARFADSIEEVERKLTVVAEETGREVRRQSREHPWRTALTALGAGILLSRLGRR
ncbi:MAG TPA: ferritin-like domain-containing protein [Gemmatimonadaceae bacterium]|nr:ferritin-like domain-containing protein [Gemmatimonadaceae bacterium]